MIFIVAHDSTFLLRIVYFLSFYAVFCAKMSQVRSIIYGIFKDGSHSTYYLRHQTEVDEYLKRREIKAIEIRKQNEARFNTQGLRERLLARQS